MIKPSSVPVLLPTTLYYVIHEYTGHKIKIHSGMNGVELIEAILPVHSENEGTPVD